MTGAPDQAHSRDEVETLKAEILSLVGRYAELAHAPARSIPESHPWRSRVRSFGAPEVQALVESSLDFWLTTGRFNNDAFERRMRKFLGRKYVLTCNSGSSANLLGRQCLCSPFPKIAVEARR